MHEIRDRTTLCYMKTIKHYESVLSLVGFEGGRRLELLPNVLSAQLASFLRGPSCLLLDD